MDRKSTLKISGLVLIALILLASSSVLAQQQVRVFINGIDLTTEMKPYLVNNSVMVSARAFAKTLGAEIKWFAAIKTLQLNKANTLIKLMENNPFIQINDQTIRSNNTLVLKNGQAFLPLQEVAGGFGYLFQRSGNSVYIIKPESLVEEVFWQRGGQQLVVKMNKISPYRISSSADSKQIILEIDKTALAEDFKDNISNRNFYLKIEEVNNLARLRLIINGKYKIPFQRDYGIEEDNNNLVINFLPGIKEIEWIDYRLEIRANGEFQKPEVFLLHNPRRMVIDIADLMLKNFDLILPENDWIKDIRVSQFKYDPVILRVVLELHPERYLELEPDSPAKSLIIKAGAITQLDDLAYYNRKVVFSTDHPIVPDIFTLENPERLVINLLNTVRGKNCPDLLKIDEELVRGIRSSRFNDETVRIVVDLNKYSGYDWRRKQLADGRYQHIIALENEIERFQLLDKEIRTDLNIAFSAVTDYEIKKLASPDRLVIDLKGMVNNIAESNLPAPAGLVKDLRMSQLSHDPPVTRLVLEMDGYFNYQLYSVNPGKEIGLSLERGYLSERGETIIIDPGHGGFDPGAIGFTGLQEKEINLTVAKKVRDLLTEAGYDVVLTREDDIFISLKERVDLANQINGRLFISIHANAAHDRYSEGTETYFAPAKMNNSGLLADLIQQELLAALKRVDRGVKKRDLYVIKYTNMAAVLLELAFVSNPHEETLLESDLFREKAALAIFKGIERYIKETE